MRQGRPFHRSAAYAGRFAYRGDTPGATDAASQGAIHSEAPRPSGGNSTLRKLSAKTRVPHLGDTGFRAILDQRSWGYTGEASGAPNPKKQGTEAPPLGGSTPRESGWGAGELERGACFSATIGAHPSDTDLPSRNSPLRASSPWTRPARGQVMVRPPPLPRAAYA